MKHAGRWIAALGLMLAAALFVSEGVAPVAVLLSSAGAGLLVAAAVHVVPMLFNARAWQRVLPSTGAASWPAVAVAVWIRESVNGLLPVARIGGEIASYRWLVRRGVPPSTVAASLVVDMAVALASQAVFCLLGVLLLARLRVASPLLLQLAIGAGVLVLPVIAFAMLQKTRRIERLLARIESALANRWAGVIERSERVDRAVRDLCGDRRRLAACFGWQVAGWMAGAGEIWLALHYLGHDATLEQALLIEAVIQMISSVAFVVPGALGLQEAGFLAIGAALGIDGPTALALSVARRVRDIAIFFPGLLAWQWAEATKSVWIRR